MDVHGIETKAEITFSDLQNVKAHLTAALPAGEYTMKVYTRSGLGDAFGAFLGAELVPGVDLVLRETKLEDYIKDADVVVTGEGRLDGQTVMGKAPIGVAKLAKRHGKRVIAFCGCVGAGVEAVNAAGIDAFFPILRTVTTLEEALEKGHAAENLAATAEQVFRCFRLGAQ